MSKSMLYTRTGDAGQTSLVGGERAPKNCVRLDAYGTLDEFSSFLGVVLSDPACTAEARGQLQSIQDRLFDVGCYLATAVAEGEMPGIHGLCEKDIARVEGWIDALDEQTPKIRAFVLPGGTPLSAHTHVARAVCRRAERRVFALCEESYVDPLVTRYLNRLSDYLFILARYFNFMGGVEEITWHPAK